MQKYLIKNGDLLIFTAPIRECKKLFFFFLVYSTICLWKWYVDSEKWIPPPQRIHIETHTYRAFLCSQTFWNGWSQADMSSRLERVFSQRLRNTAICLLVQTISFQEVFSKATWKGDRSCFLLLLSRPFCRSLIRERNRERKRKRQTEWIILFS